jgi:hypothetical protein
MIPENHDTRTNPATRPVHDPEREWPELISIWEKAVGETHSFLAPEDFAQIIRSELDTGGRPYPLLHMELK